MFRDQVRRFFARFFRTKDFTPSSFDEGKDSFKDRFANDFPGDDDFSKKRNSGARFFGMLAISTATMLMMTAADANAALPTTQPETSITTSAPWTPAPELTPWTPLTDTSTLWVSDTTSTTAWTPRTTETPAVTTGTPQSTTWPAI